jgi:transcriptional regulator with XRE-family HTH domain
MPSRRRRPVGSAHSPRYRRFLKLLRAARAEARLTQTEVARALGRPQSFVAKCESGERRVDVIELLDFAQLYRKAVTHFTSRVNE